MYNRILRNLGYPYTFVADGLKNGRPPKYRLYYSCKDSRKPFDNTGRGNCGADKVAAYTSDPGLSNNDRWTITFCDLFFKNGYAEDLWNPSSGRKFDPTDLNSLRTYEGTIIHEFFHVDYMGFANFADQNNVDAPHIDDLEGTLNGVPTKIYGAQYCNQFAYSKAGEVNLDTSTNADTYAQYVVSRWVAKRLGWNNKYKAWMAPDPDGVAGFPPMASLLLDPVDNSTAGNNTTKI